MRTKKQSGITLIALVITIIVLLILAGVTIATLSGNNSAPQKATEASQKDAIAAAKDEIAMETQQALLEYYDNKYVNKTSTGATGNAGDDVQGVVETAAGTAVTNAKSRNKELLETSGVDTTEHTITLSTKSFTVTGTIEANGGITWSDSNASGGSGNGQGGDQQGGGTGATSITENGETVTLTQTNAKDYYGKTVAKINNVDYGLFYVDFAGTYSGGTSGAGTVYLRAKSSIGNTALNNPSLSSDALTIMKQLNPQWNTARGNTATLTSAEQAAEHLCNPQVTTWSSLQTAFETKYNTNAGDDNVKYVIGGPSVELFLASYNAKYNSIYSADFRGAGVNYTYPGYLYSNDGGTSYARSYSSAIPSSNAEGGMYLNTSSHEWLASPLSTTFDTYVCYVTSYGALTNDNWDHGFGVAPLVSLKSGVSLTVE